MGYQIAGDPVPEGADQSGAPLEQASPDAVKADAATGALGLGSAAAKPATPGGKVTLATVPPLSALIVSPVDDGDEEVVITEDGTEVDELTAQRARVTADRAGFKLRVIT
jgi:hypothetical protein